MKLILCPLKKEKQCLEKALQELGFPCIPQQDQGRWYSHCAKLDSVIALGGHGKTQFALQSQFWVTQFNPSHLIVTGAAGGLTAGLQVGQLALVTQIIEHDYKTGFNPQPHPPKFTTQTLELFTSPPAFAFPVEECLLASGDEDIVSTKRAQELSDLTGADCVAWESAGGARVSLFNQIPYCEIRGITDLANEEASSDFNQNLELVMSRVAQFLVQSL